MVKRMPIWWRMMRGHQPIGFFLLLWGTLWSLWIAARGIPPLDILLIFIAGCFLMRSAGCVVNDHSDRDIDPHVERTRSRPLASGAASPGEAKLLAGILLLAAFGLVLLTNWMTVVLACCGAVLTALYPLCKRFFPAPQLILGLSFAWAVPMSYTALEKNPDLTTLLLLLAVLLWTVAYDTAYAMADRDDDRQLGLHSTALLAGKNDRVLIVLLQLLTLGLLAACGVLEQLGTMYYLGLLVAAAMFWRQQLLLRNREPAQCIRAFANNGWVGAVIFAGLAIDLLMV